MAFDPKITQDEFAKFSRVVGQGIFATPVQPARATGLLGFDVGIAATLLQVDTGSSYWQHAVPSSSSFTHGGYAAVPRLVVSKGFSAGTVAGSYAKINNSDIKTYGASLDLPIVRGSLVLPELAARGSYSALTGIDVYNLKTYGLEVFLSKGFGPLMPYGAVGRMRTNAHGTIRSGIATVSDVTLTDQSNFNRYTAGLRLSLFLPKFVIEATQAERRSYAAKISVGF